MRAEALLDLINDTELNLPVAEWKMFGIDLWPVIRIGLYIQNADEFKMTETTKRSSLADIRLVKACRGASDAVRSFHAKGSDRSMNSDLNSEVDSLFLSDGISYAKIGGKWVDKICDPIRDRMAKLGFKSTMLHPTHNYKIPRYSSSAFIQSELDRIRLFQKQYPDDSSISESNLKGWREFIRILEDNRAIEKVPLFERVISDACMIAAYTFYFGELLERTQARVGLVVSYYGSGTALAFIAACRKSGIRAVDLQHGCQGRDHFAYGRFKSIPEGGFNTLPDTFWCWSESEASAINEWSETENSSPAAIVGRNLIEDEWLSLTNPAFEDVVIELQDRMKDITQKNHLLYTMQGKMDADERSALVELIEESGGTCFWWLRGHPCHPDLIWQLKEELSNKGLANFNAEEATEFPLGALLRQVNCHITGYSSTVLEAARFGVPSVVTNRLADTFFAEALANGSAKAAYDKKYMLAAISEQIERGKADGDKWKQSGSSSDVDAVLTNIVRERPNAFNA